MNFQHMTMIAELSLKRYPEQTSKSTLQAWDSADEYLLATLSEQPESKLPLVIVNDSFGALACALHAYQPVSSNDSFISQKAIKQNWLQNQLSGEPSFADSLTLLTENVGTVLIKIPKTLALLEYQLSLLSNIVTEQTTILAAAKAQDIHTSTLQLFEKWLGKTTTSLAWKKSRIIFCKPDGKKRPALSPLVSWPLEKSDYTIANYPSVFSRTSLDIGARFFMANLPQQMKGNIADLGCGNGVIGLMALEKNPDANVLFCDESYMAVASARYNVEHNRPLDLKRSQFIVDNCLSQQPANSLQLVLCNPPFHQSNAITDHIAKEMFTDAKRCLAKHGELRIIGNRHLGYYHQLKQLFGNCETIAANNKFVILKSIKVK